MKSLQNIGSSLKTAVLLAMTCLLCLANVASASDWNLRDKDGAKYTLSALHGKWVLVNFWAPWCPECIEEIPGFNALHRQRKDLQVIGIAVMYDNRKQVLDKVASHSIAFPTVFGNEDTAAEFDGLNGVPTSFLYAPDGKLIGRHQGPLTQQQIEQVIAQQIDPAGLFTP